MRDLTQAADFSSAESELSNGHTSKGLVLDEKDVETEDILVEVISEVVVAVDKLVALDEVVFEVVEAKDEVVIVDDVIVEDVEAEDKVVIVDEVIVVEEEDLVVVVVVVDIFATGTVHLGGVG